MPIDTLFLTFVSNVEASRFLTKGTVYNNLLGALHPQQRRKGRKVPELVSTPCMKNTTGNAHITSKYDLSRRLFYK